MKFIQFKYTLIIYSLIVIVFFLTSCSTKSNNSKHQVDKIGFIGFYLDMDYLKVNSIMDSLLGIKELNYFETMDVLGNKQKNLYYVFSEISPFLSAKVNLRGSSIIDDRLTSIQLTLCSSSKSGEQKIKYNCDLKEVKRLFGLFEEKYGKPTLLDQGIKYDWLAKRISNIYFPGPKGRWFMDKIYYWEKGNYIIYFDLGYPEISGGTDNPAAITGEPELPDSTGAPIIYYDFTGDYIDVLLDKASRIEEDD